MVGNMVSSLMINIEYCGNGNNEETIPLELTPICYKIPWGLFTDSLDMLYIMEDPIRTFGPIA